MSAASTVIGRPGQVWEDKDPREPGRRLKVLSLDGGGSGFAICEVVVGTGHRPNAWGRQTRIRVSRMRRSYRLVEPTDAGGAA